MRANSSTLYSHSLSLNLLKYETDNVHDWNAKFLDACVTLLFIHSRMSHDCLQPSVHVCLHTLPALTNAGAKTTTKYIKKATAVTADSMMVNCSTLNPVFWGFILCARVCYCMLCGLACLDFVSSVFRCFGQTLGSEKVFYRACLKSNHDAQG